MKIEVCYTPDLIEQFELEGKTVVVIDVLRATSCMVAGLNSGVDHIRPVANVDDCLALGKQGYTMAGERGGQKIPEFHIGNSPFDYMDESLKGKKVATTTTNGTKAIALSAGADKILIGAFLNLSAVVEQLRGEANDVVLFCAGWKGRYNLEDSLFAGAVCEALAQEAELKDDAALSAMHLYKAMKHDLAGAMTKSNHAQRLAGFGITKDIGYCSRIDEFSKVPYLNIDNKLVV